ncbi:hypothetical protein TrLO_g4102 [Triparma laevis f. longispina]|uniref:Uncharacterized protein n=1 Tax=Triparma laevis f. longispina TaxID=1714387 RepID=A0A9W7CIL0_9STRA|nr:hypothetical protein TrLO_g4102 [Triparma laevis f. longispina]
MSIKKTKDEEIQNLKKMLESVKNADKLNQRRESWVEKAGGGLRAEIAQLKKKNSELQGRLDDGVAALMGNR